MKLMKSRNADPSEVTRIHETAVLAAQGFKRAESELIESLIEVDRKRVFAVFGYSSLFTYATRALKLSESVTLNAIAVARKSVQVPALREEIKSGAISIAVARKIVPVLESSNSKEWIERAKSMTVRQLEKQVARVNPQVAAPERAKYVQDKRLSVTLGVDEAVMLKLRRAQDLVSQSTNSAATLEDTLAEMVEVFLKHKDPVEKAKRVIAKKGTVQPNESTKHMSRDMQPICSRSLKTPIVQMDQPRPRGDLSAAVRHPVNLRDQGRCQKEGCGSRCWVDIHHILPVSQGGGDTVDNLITLCRAHHQQEHSSSP